MELFEHCVLLVCCEVNRQLRQTWVLRHYLFYKGTSQLHRGNVVEAPEKREMQTRQNGGWSD